jgi:hypothetical protein
MRLKSGRKKPKEPDHTSLVRFINNPKSVVVCSTEEFYLSERTHCADCGRPIQTMSIVASVRAICISCSPLSEAQTPYNRQINGDTNEPGYQQDNFLP